MQWVHRLAFHDLSRLTTLYLFNNSLTELSGASLVLLSALEYLRLNNNPWECDCKVDSNNTTNTHLGFQPVNILSMIDHILTISPFVLVSCEILIDFNCTLFHFVLLYFNVSVLWVF